LFAWPDVLALVLVLGLGLADGCADALGLVLPVALPLGLALVLALVVALPLGLALALPLGLAVLVAWDGLDGLCCVVALGLVGWLVDAVGLVEPDVAELEALGLVVDAHGVADGALVLPWDALPPKRLAPGEWPEPVPGALADVLDDPPANTSLPAWTNA
jgi:hypothetical protein